MALQHSSATLELPPYANSDEVLVEIHASASAGDYVDRLLNRCREYFQIEFFAATRPILDAILSQDFITIEQRLKSLIYRAANKYEQGEFEDALSDYKTVIESPYASREVRGIARLARGIAMWQHSRIFEALGEFNQIADGPGFSKSHRSCALIYRGVIKQFFKDTEGELRDYESAVEMIDSAPEYKAAALYNRGSIKELKGEIRGAISDYNKIIETSTAPPNLKALALLSLSFISGREGDPESEFEYYDKLLRMKGVQANLLEAALFSRAVLRLLENEFGMATEDCEDAIKASLGGGGFGFPTHVLRSAIDRKVLINSDLCNEIVAIGKFYSRGSNLEAIHSHLLQDNCDSNDLSDEKINQLIGELKHKVMSATEQDERADLFIQISRLHVWLGCIDDALDFLGFVSMFPLNPNYRQLLIALRMTSHLLGRPKVKRWQNAELEPRTLASTESLGRSSVIQHRSSTRLEPTIDILCEHVARWRGEAEEVSSGHDPYKPEGGITSVSVSKQDIAGALVVDPKLFLGAITDCTREQQEMIALNLSLGISTLVQMDSRLFQEAVHSIPSSKQAGLVAAFTEGAARQRRIEVMGVDLHGLNRNVAIKTMNAWLRKHVGDFANASNDTKDELVQCLRGISEELNARYFVRLEDGEKPLVPVTVMTNPERGGKRRFSVRPSGQGARQIMSRQGLPPLELGEL